MRHLHLFIILSVGFIDYLGIGLVYPVFAALLFDAQDPLLPADASASYRGALLGILIALTPLAQFMGAPILGSLSDRRGRRFALSVGLALGVLAYGIAIAGICFHSMILLFAYRFLVGISNGTVSVAQATMADISTPENKTKRFAWLFASFGFGFSIGPFLGGQLADPSLVGRFGYAGPFIASGVMCLINLVMVIKRFPETHRATEKTLHGLSQPFINIKRAFEWPNLKWLFIAGFTFSFGWAFFNEFVPILLRHRFDFTLPDVGYYYAWGGVGFALSTGLATAPLLKRFSPEKLVVGSLLGCAMCMLLYIATPHSLYIWASLPLMMYCLAMIYPTISVTISNQVSAQSQGKVLGSYQAVQACAMGLSPLFLGSAVGAYPDLTAWVGAFAMSLAALSFWRGCRFDIPIGQE